MFKPTKKTLVTACSFLFIGLIFGGLIVWVYAQPIGTFTISGGAYPSAFSYSYEREGSLYYAKNSFGANEFWDTNGSEVFQYVLDNGDAISIGAGTFDLPTIVRYDSNTVIEGEGTSTILSGTDNTNNGILVPYDADVENVIIRDLLFDNPDPILCAGGGNSISGIRYRTTTYNGATDNFVFENLFGYDMTQIVHISNFTNGIIRNCFNYNNDGVDGVGANIFDGCSNILIDGLTVINSGDSGVDIASSTENAVHSIRVINCFMDRLNRSDLGVPLVAQGNSHNIEFSHNTVLNQGYNVGGIEVRTASGYTPYNVTISSNYVANSWGWGIRNRANDTMINDNILVNNQDGGINTDGFNTQIQNNRIFSDSEITDSIGIRLYGTTLNFVTGNVIRWQEYGVREFIAGANSNVVFGNSIINCTNPIALIGGDSIQEYNFDGSGWIP